MFIVAYFPPKGKEDIMNNDIQRKKLVTDTLIKIGADVENSGFYILRDVVLAYMEYEFPAVICQKEVFEPIAEKRGINYKCAYRNVRFLIGKIMLHGDAEFLESYFGMAYSPEKGTVMPKAFITRIADDVKMQCEELSEKGDVDMSDERKQVIEEINKEIEGISNIAKIRFLLDVIKSYKEKGVTE